MRNLMKFGIVLVVVAMVTSIAFADNDYIGPDGGTWCDEDNWSTGDIPERDDEEKVRLHDGQLVLLDHRDDYENCDDFHPPTSCDTLEIRDGCLQVGTTIANGDPANVHVHLTIYGDLEMSDDDKDEISCLNIVNGDVKVKKESKDVGKKGNMHIIVAAGSSLFFEDGVRIGTSNGYGCDNVHTLDIAGDFENDDSRFRMEGGTLTINLTGVGTFLTDETTRLSRKRDSRTIVNISDNASFTHTQDIEIGSDKGEQDCPPSLEINISDNGSWSDGDAGKDIEYKKDNQSVNATITDNGSLSVKNFGENDDAELNLIVDANGQFEVTEDFDFGQGSILITGNAGFEVGDDFELGIEGDAYMLVATTGDVHIDDKLKMGKEGDDAELTIDGCRMDVDGSLEMGENSSIDILGDGQLVIDTDDPNDWDELNAMIDDGKIMTSEEGMVVVSDYGVTNEGKLTIQIAIPVDVDIKPGVCPNALRVNFTGKGVYPVAIVGSEDFDVLDVNVATITLQGVAPLRSSYEDVSTFGGGELCECAPLGPDGFLDLTLKFDRATILAVLEGSVGDLSAIPHRTELPLTLLAETDEGTLVSGKDCLVILNRGAVKVKK